MSATKGKTSNSGSSRKASRPNKKNMIIVRDVASLRRQIKSWRDDGDTIGLIPTMGALHEGHLSLVRAAMRECDRAVATIFVNPSQFAPSEDFATYPRDEADDITKLDLLSTDLLFAPGVDEMYPDGFSSSVAVSGVSEGLCGDSRPHFFGGVATVVSKLLIQALPDRAYFGEKDFQQLQVVRRMVRDLDIPSQIVGVPTVREPDGLAMSSRNWYLSPTERAIAPTLYKVLQQTAQAVADGMESARAIAQGTEQLVEAGFDKVDYLSVCDSATLKPLARAQDAPSRVLVAAFLGQTRLIDNVAVP